MLNSGVQFKENGHNKKHIFLRFPSEGPVQELIEVYLQRHQEKKYSLDELFEIGAVYVNKERTRNPTLVVSENSLIEIYLEPKRYNCSFNIEERTLFEDENFLIIHKPAQLPCHATVDNEKENLKSFIEQHKNISLFLPHRLDQETEGILIFCKNKISLKAVNQQLAAGTFDKRYLMLVHGFPTTKAPFLVRHSMEPGLFAPKVLSPESRPGWKECLLSVEKIHSCGAFSLVEVKLITGRTHQIRAQMKALGHPLVGDKMYGTDDLTLPLQLCCYELEFPSIIKIQKHRFSLLETTTAFTF